MRNLLVLSFAFLSSAAAHADQKVVDCNITFGPIAEIKISQSFSSDGSLSAQLLTSSGVLLNAGVIDAAAWAKRDLNFQYGKGYQAGRLHFYQDNHHDWMYEEFDGDSTEAMNIGYADCE